MDREKTIGLVLVIIGIAVLVGVFVISMSWAKHIGNTDYEYQLQKCSQLGASTYDFNIKLETNAQYSQGCFRMLNHPYARFHETVGYYLLFGFLNMVMWLIIYLIVNRDRCFYL